jgi:hypothetical protein
MSTRAQRTIRGLSAAAFATLTASGSHSIADGYAVSPIALSLAFAFAAFVCIALAGRRMSTWRLALAVTISQLAFHTVFITLTPEPVAVTGTHHHEMFTVLGGTAAHDHASVAMWVGHGIAAVLTTLALRHGEVGLLTLARLAAWVVRVLVTAVVPIAAPRRIRAVEAPARRAPAQNLTRRSLLFRGPPRSALV